jgi:hypothetical protein
LVIVPGSYRDADLLDAYQDAWLLGRLRRALGRSALTS